MFLNLFIPISKVDEEKRLVYGIAAAEELDNAGEIFDYESSKPYILAWSNSFIEKTNGLSCGNLRAMHQAVSAGKLVELTCNDKAKTIEVCAKVIDNQEWEKTLEGTYTGFSFGGHALKKWDDPALKGKRYTLKPNELSLADKPCVPSAVFFEVVKVDGKTEQRKFKQNKGSVNMSEAIAKQLPLSELAKLLAGIQETAVYKGEGGEIPPDFKAAVESLAALVAAALPAETSSAKAEAEEDPGDPGAEETAKVLKVALAGEISKLVSPLQASIEKITGSLRKLDQLEKRLKTLENQPAPPKTLKTVGKEVDGSQVEESDAAKALAEIKKVQQNSTWAY